MLETPQSLTKEKFQPDGGNCLFDPDYPVVDQKVAEPEMLVNFDLAFTKTFGIDLAEPSNLYNTNYELAVDRFEQLFLEVLV
jgi:hypothetical protein